MQPHSHGADPYTGVGLAGGRGSFVRGGGGGGAVEGVPGAEPAVRGG